MVCGTFCIRKKNCFAYRLVQSDRRGDTREWMNDATEVVRKMRTIWIRQSNEVRKYICPFIFCLLKNGTIMAFMYVAKYKK